RFVFVPVAGLSLLLMELLGRMTKPAAIGVLLLALILPCALATWQRISEWDGIGNALFDSEYQRQPGFHNAIRDRIIQTLIPEKRYDEARELAKRLGRAYAVEVMTRMIEADMAYDPFRKRSALSSLPDSREDAALRAEFCGASEQLRDAIRKGREQVKTEPDLSYNSILNALKNVQKYRFGHEKLLCATGKSATKSLTPPNSKKLAASRKLLPV
ncbi:MAG: hypothetical protein LBD67_00250, partial [Candidatus Accumulibacter sp.]|nr:hypothetical protein [Accumulibacter sp.]